MNGSIGVLPDIIWYDSVGSTNDEAQARIAADKLDRVWIAAARQTRGKGRLGRHWISEPGNLYASLTWPTNAPLKRLASLSLVAGLAVRDAVLQAGVSGQVQLKWPNDVLVDGRKVTGILIETTSGTGSHIAIIGCGLNLAHHPSGTRWPATNLAACNISIEPREMLGKLRAAMHARLRQWADGAGLSGIQDDWMNAALGRGGRLLVEGGKQGVFSGLSDDGALELTLDDGSLWTHHAGDVDWLEHRVST